MEEDEDYIDPKSLPIYQKGKEIFKVVSQIADLIPDDNEMLQPIKGFMLSDASQLTVKVGGAMACGLYDVKMEAACIIRKAAMDLKLHSHSLEMYGFKEAHYYNLVQELIEEYRHLFIDWVASFDPWDYHIDRWGLFNPAGVGPFDKDPDEDIPDDGFPDEL